jgi:hypothetical protein
MPRLNNRNSLLIAFGGLLCLFSIATAHAAPLNFPTADSVTLSSPATTLTIATGSVADVLMNVVGCFRGLFPSLRATQIGNHPCVVRPLCKDMTIC